MVTLKIMTLKIIQKFLLHSIYKELHVKQLMGDFSL